MSKPWNYDDQFDGARAEIQSLMDGWLDNTTLDEWARRKAVRPNVFKACKVTAEQWKVDPVELYEWAITSTDAWAWAEEQEGPR